LSLLSGFPVFPFSCFPGEVLWSFSPLCFGGSSFDELVVLAILYLYIIKEIEYDDESIKNYKML